MKIKSKKIAEQALLLITVCLIATSCNHDNEGFNVAFMTDIHLEPEGEAVEGFTRAIETVNSLNPDLVITGGDLIMDALGQSYERADSLYNLYLNTAGKFTIPVYNTMGNHEIYGIYESSGADISHPDYGEKMFENRIGNSYYSFMHKDWKFFILNSIEDTRANSYTGLIDNKQIEWIKEELKQTDESTPLVISTHIPFVTAYTQKYAGSTLANDSSLVVYNSKEVIDLFGKHNLKLVLQGHLHTVEDVYIDGIHFITGGAVSGAWWKGPNMGFEEGYLILNFREDDFTWEYFDYGWNAG